MKLAMGLLVAVVVLGGLATLAWWALDGGQPGGEAGGPTDKVANVTRDGARDGDAQVGSPSSKPGSAAIGATDTTAPANSTSGATSRKRDQPLAVVPPVAPRPRLPTRLKPKSSPKPVAPAQDPEPAAPVVDSPPLPPVDALPPLKVSPERAKLFTKFQTKGRGVLFLNGPYWVDLQKLDDRSWEVKTRKAGGKTQTLELVATLPAARADLPPLIAMEIWGYKHYEMRGSTRMIQNFSFEDAGMSGVKPSSLKDWLLANYLTFVNKSKDPIKKSCKKPKKVKGYGPAKMIAVAVATDVTANARVRREWLGWVDKEWTFEVRVTYSTHVYKNEEYHELVRAFIRHIKKTW